MAKKFPTEGINDDGTQQKKMAKSGMRTGLRGER